MNPQAAGELVHLWLAAHDDPTAVTRQRGPVSRSVRDLAPDAEHAGVGRTKSGPAILVLLGDSLLVLQTRPGDATSPPVRATLVRLDPMNCQLGVTERFEERPDGLTRVHTWELRAGEMELEFDGHDPVNVDVPPDLTEKLGRRIATKFGWVLP